MKHEARGTKHEARILVMALMAVCSSAALAMPTQLELKKAQPLVAELMAPIMDDFKAKKKTAADVADAAVKYAAEAETEAAKFMLYRSSIPYFVRGEAYDKAADAVELMKANVKDVPASVVEEIISKATVRANREKAPRLFELYQQAKTQATAEKDVKELRKKPASPANRRKLAEALATTGDWQEALKVFASLTDQTAQMAKGEQDGSAKSAALGEFWWAYKPTYEDAEDTFKIHAAVHYRKALAAGEITGLKKNIVEQRIKEYGDAAESVKGEVKAVAGKQIVTRQLTHEGFLTRVNTLLWEGISVNDIQSFTATMSGSAVRNPGEAVGYVMDSGDGWKSVQFQHIDGRHLKCVCARFEQRGSEVRGYVERGYFAEASVAMGTDFRTVVSAKENGGYGIKDLVVTVGGKGAVASAPATKAASVARPTGSVELKTAGNSPFTVKGNEATLDLGGKYGKLEFVKCPAGTVKMVLNTEGKTKRVKISRPFWITKTPILQDNAFISPAVPAHNQGNYACLGRKEADSVISAINDEYGESLPKGMVVRLATLAELEYAYHANTLDRNDPYYDALHCHAYDDVGAKIHRPPRGKTVPNAWGLYDFADGLCLDKFDPVSVIPFGTKEEESVKAGKLNFWVRGLPDIEKDEDPLYWTDAQNAGNVSRNFLWARWLLVDEGSRGSVGGVRLVIGPDLVSEWKAKNAKK